MIGVGGWCRVPIPRLVQCGRPRPLSSPGRITRSKGEQFPAAKLLRRMSDGTGTRRTLPKFGEWDVNNPASADGFSVIFSKARDEKKGPAIGNVSSRSSADNKSSRAHKTRSYNSRTATSKKWFCCVSPSPTQS